MLEEKESIWICISIGGVGCVQAVRIKRSKHVKENKIRFFFSSTAYKPLYNICKHLQICVHLNQKFKIFELLTVSLCAACM